MLARASGNGIVNVNVSATGGNELSGSNSRTVTLGPVSGTSRQRYSDCRRHSNWRAGHSREISTTPSPAAPARRHEPDAIRLRRHSSGRQRLWRRGHECAVDFHSIIRLIAQSIQQRRQQRARFRPTARRRPMVRSAQRARSEQIRSPVRRSIQQQSVVRADTAARTPPAADRMPARGGAATAKRSIHRSRRGHDQRQRPRRQRADRELKTVGNGRRRRAGTLSASTSGINHPINATVIIYGGGGGYGQGTVAGNGGSATATASADRQRQQQCESHRHSGRW